MNGLFKNIFDNLYKYKKWLNESPKRQIVCKDIKNIFLILILTFFTLVVWSNRVNFSPDNIYAYISDNVISFSVSPKFPVQIQGEKIQTENLQVNNSYIFALSDSSFEIFSKKGKKLLSEKHNFSNPNLQISNSKHIIFDRGGKTFKVTGNRKTFYSGITDQKIMAATISDIGSYAIAVQSLRYLSEIQVFGKRNTLKFSIPISEYYITNLAMDTTGSTLAASGISSDNGDIISNIYIIDTASGIIKSQFLIPDNLITDIKFFSNGNFVAIGDKYATFINPKTKSVVKQFYENNILKFYDFNKSGEICFCLSQSINEASKNILMKFDTSGKEIQTIKADYDFDDIIMKGNKIIGLTKDKIISYNMWGNFEGYINLGNCYRKILPASRGYIYAINPSKISKIKLSGFKIKI